MKLPNWFRIAWWLALTGLLTWFLFRRYPDLVAGRAVAADIVAFVIWVALLLAPVFSEVSLLGITLKHEIKELKDEVRSQLSVIRSELSSAVDVRTNVSPQFHFLAPPPDSRLPDIEERVRAAVADAVRSHGAQPPIPPAPGPSDLAVEPDVQFLFSTRYHIEKELHRIASGVAVASPMSHATGMSLTRLLVSAGAISPELANAIRDVYRVCSPAIHGEPVTPAQVAFVRDVASDLVGALRAIS